MKDIIFSLKKWLIALGINPKNTFQALTKTPKYFKDKNNLKNQLKTKQNKFVFGNSYPCLFDENEEGGNASGHYFHQDLLIAQKIFLANPKKHVDIGSRIDGFVSHIASFREIEVFDIREIKAKIKNIKFSRIDLMGELDENLINYTDSLSCLHTLEHLGLGRYGDKIDSNGYLTGLENLTKILKQGGKFYFSIPIGPQRIEFNAHRVFSVSNLLDLITTQYIIDSFSYVNDKGDLFKNISLIEDDILNNYGCNYGCGIFELTKI